MNRAGFGKTEDYTEGSASKGARTPLEILRKTERSRIEHEVADFLFHVAICMGKGNAQLGGAEDYSASTSASSSSGC